MDRMVAKADFADFPGPALDAEALFRAHAGFVANFLTRLGAPVHDIDDLVQEVFVVAHRRGGFAPGTARPTTWLARIAINVMANASRARRGRREAPDEAVLRDARAPDSLQTQLEASDALTRVRRALESLDLKQRALFVLFEIEGESCGEIAAGLGIPTGTVYSRLHAARQAFHSAYDRLVGEERKERVGT